MTETTLDFDVVVVGGGPGGYVAAIRAAQLGLRVACVEKWRDPAGQPALGGTCLNVGCIPSKALLDSSHLYATLTGKGLAEHGIAVAETHLDLARMMARKDKVVRTLTVGIAGLFKKHGIRWLQGEARLLGPGRVRVTPTGDAPASAAASPTSPASPAGASAAPTAPVEPVEPVELTCRHIVLATGSEPIPLSAAPVDGARIVDSTGALAFAEVPKTLGVIGAGVIGLELGSVWRRLGAQVVVLEALPAFLPMVEEEIAAAALKSLSRQGLDIRLGARLIATQVTAAGVEVRYEQGGKTESLICERLVVAVGRRPYTAGLGLAAVGLACDARGFLPVNRYGETAVPGIHAVGDVAGPPLLAHKASEEGVVVAERIAGQKSEIDHRRIPFVVYTWPEIAWVGQTSAELTAMGRAFRVGSFPFLANGRAKAAGEKEGMVKILADAETDEILGVHLFGPNASELIAEAVTAMEFGAASEDLARTVHAHPTLAEALHEAALAVDGRPLHI